MTIHEEIIQRIRGFEERGAKPTQMIVILGAVAKREFFAGIGKLYEPVPGWAHHKPLGEQDWIGQIENVAMYYDVDCSSWHVQWSSVDALERMRVQREVAQRTVDRLYQRRPAFGGNEPVTAVATDPDAFALSTDTWTANTAGGPIAFIATTDEPTYYVPQTTDARKAFINQYGLSVPVPDVVWGFRDHREDAHLVSLLESRGREHNVCATAHAQLPMTPTERELASAAWSSRLRELQAETREKERHQVLVDNSWWDD